MTQAVSHLPDLTLFLASTLAPALTSSLADWLKPCQDASCRAVFPSWGAHRREPRHPSLIHLLPVSPAQAALRPTRGLSWLGFPPKPQNPGGDLSSQFSLFSQNGT